MYSKEFFLEQFEKLETETLIEKFATRNMTDEARGAVIEILNSRGIFDDELASLAHQSKKDQYLRTGVTNQCDFCGKGLFPIPFSMDGQRFCDIDCFHTSRLRLAAVDLTEEQVLDRAKRLKESPCPKCSMQGQWPDMHETHFIVSMVFFVTTSTESALTCKACANRNNLWAALSCMTFGWWSVKGIFMTPIQIAANIDGIVRRRVPSIPSPALVDFAKLSLAEEYLESTGGGRWGLRA